MTEESKAIFCIIGLGFSIIWIIGNAISFSDRDYSRKREIMNELGVYGLFYFTIPFFSMFYHFVIEHQRKNNGIITKLFQRREINKLLKNDPEIVISKINLIEKNHIDPSTYEHTAIKVAKIIYRYDNKILDIFFGEQIEFANGILADKLKNIPMPIFMTATELKLMLLNNRLDNLQSKNT